MSTIHGYTARRKEKLAELAMGHYRIEVSPNNRAGCKNADCKDQGVKIVKGDLRFGVLVELPGGNSSWAYRHWGCVTPKQIENLKTSIENDLDLFDGYDELPEDAQEKMRRALEQGHVDDEDWKWDREFNRPGMTGYKKKTPKKKAEEKPCNGACPEHCSQMQQDGANGAEASPSKPAPKKRRRGAKDEDGDEGEVAPKKARGRAKKGALKTEDDEADEDGHRSGSVADAGETSNKKNTVSKAASRSKVKKTVKPVDKVTESDADGPAKREADSEEAPQAKPRASRARKAKVVKKEESEEDDDDEEEDKASQADPHEEEEEELPRKKQTVGSKPPRNKDARAGTKTQAGPPPPQANEKKAARERKATTTTKKKKRNGGGGSDE